MSQNGAKVSGVIKAYDEYEAVSQLRENFTVVTKIEPVKESEAAAKKRRYKPKELAVLCSQFAIILASGLPIVRCVEMVAAQNEDKAMRRLLEKVAEDVDGGFGLAQSFEKNGPGLPTTFLQTIRAGEQSGTLETCFARLHAYYDKTSKTKGKLASALIYPAIVIVVAIVVFIIIMVVAVPLFTETFESLGTELPAITKALIATSDFLTGYWWLIIGLIALFFFARLAIVRTEQGRLKLSQWQLTVLPMHKLRAMNAAAQFASNMATVLTAGLPIVQALDVAADVVENYTFACAVRAVKANVEQGRGVSESMAEHSCFPNMLTEMTGVGEKAGTMEQTLEVVSDYYSNEVQVSTDRLLSLMEPVITICLAVFTVILLLAVYLPMFSMYGSM